MTPVDRELAVGPTEIISVDCFDTLVCRRVPKPSDIHLITGKRLREAGYLKPHVSFQTYAYLRVLAEETARAKKERASGSVEVTLSEIHEVLAPGASIASPDQTAAIELDVERDHLMVDRRVVDFLRSKEDLRLVIVSDTYFSESQMRDLLAFDELKPLEIERIFTSSDHSTGKAGNLWGLVSRELSIDPNHIVHFGDNAEADVECARRAGIRGVYLPFSTDRFKVIEVREGIVGRDTVPTVYCDDVAGDGGLTAARRRATLLVPDRPMTSEEEVTWEAGISVLGPVLTGFATWVLERTQALGATRTLFLMREGRFLKELVDRSLPVEDWFPRTEAVWISREACARASLYTGSEEELRSLLTRLRPPSPEQLIDSLGLLSSDIPNFDDLTATYVATSGDASAAEGLLSLVLADPALIEKVVQSSRLRRTRLLRHVREAAGPGSGPVAIVDVGWSGSIQESLQAMVDADGADLEFHGLYMLAHIGATERVLRGVVIEGFLGALGVDPFEVSGITGGPEIIELACTCAEGSLLEIGEDGRPILAPSEAGPRENASRELVQLGVRTFQDEWFASFHSANSTFDTSRAATAIYTRILKRWISQPNHDEALAFSWWIHEENYGSIGTDKLVPLHFLPTLTYRSAENLHWLSASELYWVGGAAALIDNETSDSVLLMREGKSDPGRFSFRSPVGDVTISLEGTDKSNEAIDKTSIPITANRRGLCLTEWSTAVAGVARVVICPSHNNAIYKLDLLEIIRSVPGSADVALFSWRSEDNKALLPISGASWLTSEALLVGRATKISIDVPPSNEISPIRVTMAGAYLSLSDGQSPAHATNEDELSHLRQEINDLHQTKLFRAAAIPRRIYGSLRKPPS
jgi:FMN phosphatase YigB (HAD superfamily)